MSSSSFLARVVGAALLSGAVFDASAQTYCSDTGCEVWGWGWGGSGWGSWELDCPYLWGCADDYDPWDFDSYDPGGDSGSGGQPECKTTDPAAMNEYADALASRAAREIKQKNWKKKEYTALIYRDDNGSIRITSLVEGEADRGSMDPPPGGWSRTIGIVHNHPHDVLCISQMMCNANRNPSVVMGPFTGSDWNTAENIVNRGASASTLVLYLLDPYGVLREFDYKSRSNYYPVRVNNEWIVRPGPVLSLDLSPTYCPE